MERDMRNRKPASVLFAPIAASVVIAAWLLAGGTPSARAADAGQADVITDDTAATCREAAVQGLPDVARDALARIDGDGRQLLALRGYLRARDLEARWSWDEARIQAYQDSPEQRAAHAQVAKVQDAFAAAHPGYRLHVNLQVRSLEEQLRKWNGNASVAAAADALAAAAGQACDPARPAAFAAWLRGWRPPQAVNLAVPGLSSHGQGRAYDFQVMQGDALVAGTDSRSRQSQWIDAGWATRLATAVRESGAAFTGPLASPDEPWHYSYMPPAHESDAATAAP
jgi:hypothetical protein